MADQYDFVWTTASKPGFTVQPQTKDTTSTSLVLTGRGSANWGKDLQQNLLKILESFASQNPPANPVTGQIWFNTRTKQAQIYDADLVAQGKDPWATSLGGGATSSSNEPTAPQVGSQWYDPNTGVLKMWNGSTWEQIYPLRASEVQKVAFVSEYNNLAQQINKVIGAPQGTTLATSFGWNQTGSVIPVETPDTITNQKWINMQTLVKKVCTFLGLSSSNVGDYGFMYESGNSIPIGVKTMEANYVALEAAVASLSTGTNRYKPIAAALESSAPTGGSATRTTPWYGVINHTVTATFANKAAQDAFFNSGGTVQFSPALANGITSRDTEYRTFLASIGTVKFSITGSVDTAGRANATGYYDLTTTNKLIFGHSSGQVMYQVYARLEGTNKIVFQITFTNPGTLYNTLYGGVGGTLTSRTTLQKAISTYLNSPAIAFPTLTQTTIG